MHVLFRYMDRENVGVFTRESWNEVFVHADLNKNGTVSRAEWRTQYGALIAPFDFVDENGDGFLSLYEWDRAFKRLDHDQQGSISAADFVKAALESKYIDLRTFYAVGVAFMGEGIGSMCYHLCPSVETFQFDTCFMIPIANVLALALMDWRASSKSDNVTAMKYIMYILIPVWMINFIGTWYDIGAFNMNWLYWVYAGLVVLWASIVSMLAIRRICHIPGNCGLASKCILQVGVVALVASAFLLPRVRAKYFSGTANLFLEISVIVMIGVVARQIYQEDLRYMTCQPRDLWARMIKNFYCAILFVVGALAIICFKEKVAIVEPGVTPAESHDANAPCVFAIFDLHDVWHFLSSIALALFAMLLLDIRVNSWARRMGIQLLFEQPGLEDPEESDSSSGESPVCSPLSVLRPPPCPWQRAESE